MRFHSLNKHKEDCYVDPVKLKHIAELGLEDANLLHHNSISSRQFDKLWEKLSRRWRFIQFINAISHVRSPSLNSSHPRRGDRGTRIKMGITGIGHDIPRLGSCVPSVSSEVLPCFKVIISVYLNSLCGYQKIKSERKIGSGKWCQKTAFYSQQLFVDYKLRKADTVPTSNTVMWHLGSDYTTRGILSHSKQVSSRLVRRGLQLIVLIQELQNWRNDHKQLKTTPVFFCLHSFHEKDDLGFFFWIHNFNMKTFRYAGFHTQGLSEMEQICHDSWLHSPSQLSTVLFCHQRTRRRNSCYCLGRLSAISPEMKKKKKKDKVCKELTTYKTGSITFRDFPKASVPRFKSGPREVLRRCKDFLPPFVQQSTSLFTNYFLNRPQNTKQKGALSFLKSKGGI